MHKIKSIIRLIQWDAIFVDIWCCIVEVAFSIIPNHSMLILGWILVLLTWNGSNIIMEGFHKTTAIYSEVWLSRILKARVSPSQPPTFQDSWHPKRIHQKCFHMTWVIDFIYGHPSLKPTNCIYFSYLGVADGHVRRRFSMHVICGQNSKPSAFGVSSRCSLTLCLKQAIITLLVWQTHLRQLVVRNLPGTVQIRTI